VSVAKWARIENNQLLAISETEFAGASPIPPNLQTSSLSELITDAKVKDGQIASKGKGARVALIFNWKMRCGISTYNESLSAKLLPMLDDYKLFIEHNDSPTSSVYDLDGYTLSSDQVLPCWKRGEPLDNLVAAIRDYDPDTVIISHEYGLFPSARYWLSLMTQLSRYRTIVILHSVFPKHQDKVVVETSIKEAVVHLAGAKTALENKGVSAKVSVIPHGCYTANQTRLWNIYRSQNTFVQIGFALRYKHFETSIKTVALLKTEFPDVFFTAVLSETDFNNAEHTAYYNQLLALIDDLGLVNHVALIRGFQSDQVVSAYMRTNTACLLPYGSAPEHEVFGASGAARLAMASGIPVITSTFHHFEDLPTFKADDEAGYAMELGKLFRSKAAREWQVKRQNAHVEANSWKVIAGRYHDLITKP
jgi:glycosyltransferase involved in cell wall biosynthesis